jgi:low affinity Fe/Cu permease
MDTNKVKKLEAKVADYTRFAFVLLAVSVFLYIGVLIPTTGEGRTDWQLYTITGTTILFLATSFTLFNRVIKYKRKLNELEE